jgi:FdhD protein
LKGSLITHGYDIGRHNAFDKMIGKVVIGDLCDLKETIAFSTGRLSSDIVLKALRCKIPCLISRSAPLEGAVNLAREHDLTLIGFLRGKRFNLYTNFEALEK